MHRIAVFVDGCFWHACQKHSNMPANNRTFWKKKLTANRTRDAAVEAAQLFSYGDEFPVLLTRELEIAKPYLRECGEGKRFGLIASSGASRLRAHGIEVSKAFRDSISYPKWFLNEESDFRSSNSLELPATEFDCQGLELDWTCVCWGGDFVRGSDGEWVYRRLKSSWNLVPPNKIKMREYMRNKYRVLLTRARMGMVIWVPHGSPDDPTREPSLLDATANFLRQCGLTEISD